MRDKTDTYTQVRYFYCKDSKHDLQDCKQLTYYNVLPK